MEMVELIWKKKRDIPLTGEEIQWMVDGFLDQRIPDYQMSAFLMACCFTSMTSGETAALTQAMAHSGEMLDLSSLGGFTVDKHSTGGVGDKTTLIVGPICASCGVYVPKTSGRGLGHTGGTVDKLESIPGFQTDLPFPQFLEVVQQAGFAVTAHSSRLAPADQMLYELRDASCAVDSIPLISSSIMSKKLAMGADAIVLDVKTGSGAFMKTVGDARKLAASMMDTAQLAGKPCRAVITNMDKPLGRAVGNAVEVMEAIRLLRGELGPASGGDLYKVSIELAANMLCLAGKGTLDQCRVLAAGQIQSGAALESLKKTIALQGGNPMVTEDFHLFPQPGPPVEIRAKSSGFISSINCEAVGLCAQLLGAGRTQKGQKVDPAAGLVLQKLQGQPVEEGEVLALLYPSKERETQEAERLFQEAYSISAKYPKEMPAILV